MIIFPFACVSISYKTSNGGDDFDLLKISLRVKYYGFCGLIAAIPILEQGITRLTS